jgi:hypothetical protein
MNFVLGPISMNAVFRVRLEATALQCGFNSLPFLTKSFLIIENKYNSFIYRCCIICLLCYLMPQKRAYNCSDVYV